ncbi:MAG: lipid II flippase MurJ, partial [Patescibacteria group bacterium]
MSSFAGRYVPRGSVVLAATTFGSYALGLLRDRIFAQRFGLSESLDSYNAAFLVPDFLFNLLVASGIAAATVPLYLEIKKRNAKQADVYISALLTLATIVMLVVSIVVVIFAPQFSLLVAPGLSEGGQVMVVSLMRVLAFSSVLFAASNTLGAMLVAKKRFFWYGVSPILYNVGIIGGSLWLAPRFGIQGVAYGTLAGAVLHLAVRFWDAWQSGWRWREDRFPKQELVRTFKLMLPKMVGHPVELATFWIFTTLASTLGAGSISALNFARNFQSVPVSLLGIAMATAVFPSLSEAALTSASELKKLFHRTALSILVVSAAAAIFLYLIRAPLVAILLGGGSFDGDAVMRVAVTLGIFCLSIPTESLSHLFARAFYAVQDTLIPVAFSVASLVVAGISAWWFIQRMGIIGLPLGFF